MPMLSRVRLLRQAGVLAFSAALLIGALATSPAQALSDIRDIAPDTQTAPAAEPDAPTDDSDMPVVEEGIPSIPDPDPLIQRPEADDAAPQPQQPVVVHYAIEDAPEPVQRLRRLILEAATTGDIERLRPLLERGANQTQISSLNADDDPITALKALSGDEDGIEILAILMDLLSTGYVVQDEGTPEEAYVWPYFVGKSLDSLTPPEKVELLRLVTAGDVAGMQELGNYNFFRIGITPDGRWKFFQGGD